MTPAPESSATALVSPSYTTSGKDGKTDLGKDQSVSSTDDITEVSDTSSGAGRTEDERRRRRRKKLCIIGGIIAGILVVAGVVVGALFGVGILGSGSKEQDWPYVPMNPAGFVNKAWCPDRNVPETDFNCQNMDIVGASIYSDVLVDMFWSDTSTLAKLNETYLTICYISGGTYETGRPDYLDFPPESLGLPLRDWPDEMYIDIRPEQPYYDDVKAIMLNRTKLAREKGCQAIEWDNVDCWQTECVEGIPPKDPTMYENQLIWNKYLAEITHDNFMAVGLKNDVDQIPELVDYFDFAINERCFNYNECDTMLPFTAQGKGVLLTVYDFDGMNITAVCDYAYTNQMMALIEYRGDWWPCAMHDAVNGEWGEWSECTHPCGTGIQDRTCDSPIPQKNGARCTGASRRTCNAVPCEYCENSTLTSPIDCENGGVCYISQKSKTETSACVCPPGFTGDRCETVDSDLFPCVYSYDVANKSTQLMEGTCENTGSCDPSVQTNETFFSSHFLSTGLVNNQLNYTYTARCICPAYWAGPSCEIKSQCADAYAEGADGDTPTCSHGRCVYLPSISEDTTVCECDEGYVGDNCDITDPCLREGGCLNGGLCAYDPTLVGWGQCTCRDGFTGLSCDIPGNYTIQCELGGVALYNMYDGEFCFCHPWSTGDNCEIKVGIDGPCDEGVCPDEAVCAYKPTTEIFGSALEIINGTAATASMSTFVTCTCQYPYGNTDEFTCTFIADLVTQEQSLPSTFSLLTECGTATLLLNETGSVVMTDAKGVIYNTYGAAAGVPPYTMTISPAGVVAVSDRVGTQQWAFPFAGAPVEDGPYVFELTPEGDAIVRPMDNNTVLYSLGTQTLSYCEDGVAVTPDVAVSEPASVPAASEAASVPAASEAASVPAVSGPAPAVDPTTAVVPSAPAVSGTSVDPAPVATAATDVAAPTGPAV